MKLYHIDRSGHLKSGQTIELVKDFVTSKMKDSEYYKDGLSSHGIHYYTDDSQNNDNLIDTIFEYERLLNYPQKLSRYQAFFCFDEKGTINFIKSKYLEDNFYKIYEIDVPEEKFEKHDMNLVRGWSHQSIAKYAKLYWEDKKNIYNENAEVIYEYLVKLPITIGKEIKLHELESLINTENEKSTP